MIPVVYAMGTETVGMPDGSSVPVWGGCVGDGFTRQGSFHLSRSSS